MKKAGMAALALLVCLPLCVFAQGQKVGFVNSTVLMEQYSVAREAEAAFQKELEDLNKEVMEEEEKLRALADSLEARKYLFSEERLKEKRAELVKKQQDFLDFTQNAELRAKKREDELVRPIVEAIEAAAKSVAEAEGFDLVLDAGPGIVVYSKPELDLTDKVLQNLEEARGSAE